MRFPVDLNPIVDGIRSISDTIATIRDSVALLPEVAETLTEIRKGVEFMGKEVHAMRKGVDQLDVEVAGMRRAVEPLVSHMDLVAARVEALDPRLEDLSLALHPLRRASSFSRRRAGDDADVEPDDAAPQDGTPGEPGQSS